MLYLYIFVYRYFCNQYGVCIILPIFEALYPRALVPRVIRAGVDRLFNFAWSTSGADTLTVARTYCVWITFHFHCLLHYCLFRCSAFAFNGLLSCSHQFINRGTNYNFSVGLHSYSFFCSYTTSLVVLSYCIQSSNRRNWKSSFDNLKRKWWITYRIWRGNIYIYRACINFYRRHETYLLF